MKDCDIYIFDEATSNIDVESENHILAMIQELSKIKTVIFITHRLKSVVDCDNIYVIQKGCLVEQGTHFALMQQKVYITQCIRHSRNWRFIVMSNVQLIIKMLKLVKPLTLPMIGAVILGVLGFLCAIGIPVISVMAVLQVTGMHSHFPLSSLLVILLILAILRGVLHYGEQAANHYIAFKLLAIIRDHVYTALRRLAPAKLDGKDKGNLISIITNDIELLEVFYAHTISPVMIALLTSLILLKFFAHLHIYAMIIAMIAYLVMAIVIPFMYIIKDMKLDRKS